MRLTPPKTKATTLHVRVTPSMLESMDSVVGLFRAAHPEAAKGITRSWLVVELLRMGLEQAQRSANRKGGA